MYLSEASLSCVTNAILIIVLTELHYTVYSLSWSFLTFSFLCCTFLFLQSTTTCTLFFFFFFCRQSYPKLVLCSSSNPDSCLFPALWSIFILFFMLLLPFSASYTYYFKFWNLRFPITHALLSHAQSHSSHSLISCAKVSSWLCWPFLSITLTFLPCPKAPPFLHCPIPKFIITSCHIPSLIMIITLKLFFSSENSFL